MPFADRCVEEILGRAPRRSGTDDRRRRRIEVPPGVNDRLGTKAAHGENKEDDLHLRPESLDPVATGDAVTVPPDKCQPGHRHRDDDGLYHQEMPYAAAIRRAWRSWVA